jgi:hypothetical protein
MNGTSRAACLSAVLSAAMFALPGVAAAQKLEPSLPPRESGLPKQEPSMPQIAANGVALCVPCYPKMTVAGASPRSGATLVVETWTGEGFETTLVEKVGVTDDQGDLPPVRLPDESTGIKAVSIEVGGRRSDRVLLEVDAFCGGPVLCGDPVPFRAALVATLFRPGQMVPVSVHGAPAFAELEVTVERLLDGRWKSLAVGVRDGADCEGHLTVSLEAFEPGLYRALVRDLGTGSTSNVVLYEVRDCLP